MNRRIPTVLVLFVAMIVLACTTPGNDPVDVEKLDVREDLSESLANDLLAFSLAMRKADLNRFSNYWNETVVATPLPQGDPQRTTVADRALLAVWSFDAEPSEFSRDDYVAAIWSLVAVAPEERGVQLSPLSSLPARSRMVVQEKPAAMAVQASPATGRRFPGNSMPTASLGEPFQYPPQALRQAQPPSRVSLPPSQPPTLEQQLLQRNNGNPVLNLN